MIDRRTFIVGVAAGVLAVPQGAFAQQQGKVWRIGFLALRHVDFVDTDNYYGPFRQGMRPLFSLMCSRSEAFSPPQRKKNSLQVSIQFSTLHVLSNDCG